MKNIFNWNKFNESFRKINESDNYQNALSLKTIINNQRKISNKEGKNWHDDEDIDDWLSILFHYGYNYDENLWDVIPNKN